MPTQPTARDLAFGVVPRINAAGRIADAELAITLMLEEDPIRAEELAVELEAVHERRRELTKQAVDAARALVAADLGSGPLLVRDDAWAPGLVGLVAGRLADSLARPVAAATLVGDEVRGSVRAPTDFHVAAALEACAALLTKRGGHAAAGGFSLLPGSWAAFSAAFAALPRPFPADAAGRGGTTRTTRRRSRAAGATPRLDARRASSRVSRRTGQGTSSRSWRSPACGSRTPGASARRSSTWRCGCAAGSRRSTRSPSGSMPDRPLPEPGDEVDLVGTLERDDFGGMPRLRLRVIDFAHRASSPLMARRLPPVLALAG